MQASETQIMACLNDELAAIEIGGKWRGVKPEYRLHALSMLAVAERERVAEERVAGDGCRRRHGGRRLHPGDGAKHPARVRVAE